MEMINHAGWDNSYGIRFLAHIDQVPGLQIQYASPASGYNSLAYSTGIYMGLNGNIGIGTTAPNSKLEVRGSATIGGGLTIQDANGYLTGGAITPGIDGLVTNGGNKHTIVAGSEVRINAPFLLAKKIKVSVKPEHWADYVFASGYHLRSLTSVENFINKYKHLPDVPSAKEVQKNDLDLGATQAILLQKIEELTLYMIQQDKVNRKQQKLITSQQKMLELLKKEIKKAKTKSK